MAPRRALEYGRALCVLAVVAMVTGATLVALPRTALAYDNVSAHPRINELAISSFLARAKLDEWLAATNLDGAKVNGLAVTELGLFSATNTPQQKTVSEWLAHGGMSADEPELPASFRHFYDPLRRSGVAYLTDHIDDVISVMNSTAPPGLTPFDSANPKVDARTWALNHEDNLYTYDAALSYFSDALARPAQLDAATGRPVETRNDYGLAWRSVGETMHLMADMTVPSHVRNDSHPYVNAATFKIGNPDPYESTIRAAEINANASGAPSSSVDYRTEDLFDLFDSVATWTNTNFYSQDTIQRWPLGSTANGQPEYPSPVLGESKDGYFWGTVDGKEVRLARVSMLMEFGMIPASIAVPWQTGTIDLTVLLTQRALLVPTAIEASSQVLDRFLPRFKAEFSAEQTGEKAFTIKGSLLHQPTLAWSGAPEVRNGAYIGYKPKGSSAEQKIWLPADSYKGGTAVEYHLDAEAGGSVSLNWDLGGYVITSQPKVLGGAALKLETKSVGTLYPGDDVIFGAEISEAPSSLTSIRLAGEFGDGTPASVNGYSINKGAGSAEVRHSFAKPGEYEVTVRVLHPQSEETMALAKVRVTIAERKVQIYPRVISIGPGEGLEVSCLPSTEGYNYSWDFGDGNVQIYGKPVAQHTYAKAGTYTMKVKMYSSSASNATLLAEDAVSVVVEAGSGCPLCGQTHGALIQKTTSRSVYYVDASGAKQCLSLTYHDEAKTKVFFSVCYLDGQRHGVEVEYSEAGVKRHEAPYVKGVLQGIYRVWDSNTGDLREETEYQNGVHQGKHVEWQTVTFGERKGQVVKEREGQLVFSAARSEPVRDGFWTEWYPDGSKKSEGNYVMGVAEGYWKEYVQGGDRVGAEGEYRSGLRAGKWTIWSWAYSTTVAYKWEGQYVAGKRQGDWIERYPAGYETGKYVDDAKKGLWTLYNPDGTLRTTFTY